MGSEIDHFFSSLLGQDFIYPNYDGSSILNIPASICHLLGVPGLGGSGLAPEILAPLGDGIRHLIVILMDGLALPQFGKNWQVKEF